MSVVTTTPPVSRDDGGRSGVFRKSVSISLFTRLYYGFAGFRNSLQFDLWSNVLVLLPFTAYFVIFGIELLHSIHPIEGPVELYKLLRTGVVLILLCGTLPLMAIVMIRDVVSSLRHRRYCRENIGQQARKKRWRYLKHFRRAKVVFADLAYRYPEEFVLRQVSKGWQLFLVVYRFTKEDEAEGRTTVQLVQLTQQDVVFETPHEAISKWAGGFKPFAEPAPKMIYQIPGCALSLRWVLDNVNYVGATLEFQDHHQEYLDPLDRFA